MGWRDGMAVLQSYKDQSLRQDLGARMPPSRVTKFVPVPAEIGGVVQRTVLICPACDGAGKTERQASCKRCEGKGLMNQDDLARMQKAMVYLGRMLGEARADKAEGRQEAEGKG